uniref:Uncharacterized protein n=1 Tax=Phlebotomus papatasi TaxID=29031 RepID=A0A1B0DM95_PHLPP
MSHAKEEYEIQLYNFTIDQLKDETKEMIHHEINHTMNTICSSIEKFITDPAAKDLFRQKKQAIVEKIKENIEKNFSNYTSNLDKHLTIPPYVLLPENKIHDVNNPTYTEKDVQELQKVFEEKKKQFEENITVLRELDKITTSYEQLEPSLKVECELQDAVQEIIEEGLDTNALSNNLQNISEIVNKLSKK